MAQRSHVPKFGNWENEDNVPYTVYFEKARKGKIGGKMINPNDPQENPDMFPDITPPSGTRNEPEEPIGQQAVTPTHEQRVSREDGDVRQFTDSPARSDNIGRVAAGVSSHQRRGSGRPVRQSAGSEHSIERSPLHPHHQAKTVGKGGGFPAGEGKNSYESTQGTPGRSRMKPVARGDDSPDKGAAVPKFGDWDENNPSSADNYTHIFNRVREERQTHGSPNISGMDNRPSYTNKQTQIANESSQGCCFPWCRK